MASSRISNSLKNAKVSMLFFILALALSFVSRKVFLSCLGDSFVGLSSTLQNILGFLNIAEMGISVAVASSLYYPIFHNNKQDIIDIISIFGYLYRWIGLFVLGTSVLLSAFLPYIIPPDEFDTLVVFSVYYAFLASSLLGYFVNYKQIILTASQKHYIVVACIQTATIIKTIIQIAVAYYYQSYYAWVIVEITAGASVSYILCRQVRRYYPWLKTELSRGRILMQKFPNVTKSCKQIFVHRLGSFAEWQATPLLIYYSVSSLSIVALYGNYSMIVDKATNFLNQVYESSISSVGNLIAEENQRKTLEIFYEFFSIRSFIGTLAACSFYHLSDTFIHTWLSESYVLPRTIVLLITIRMFLMQISGAASVFVTAYGLFWDTWAPLAQVTIMLACSLPLGIHYGIVGVLIGNITSYFLVYTVWKAVLLYHWGYGISTTTYFLRLAVIIIVAGASYHISSLLVAPLKIGNSDNLYAFAYNCFSYILTLLVVLITLYWILLPSFRSVSLKILQRVSYKS